LFFPTVPSANTLVRWVNENAFASIVQARPCPTFGRPVHLRGSPHRLRPGSSPHALRIPSRDGHPALRRIPPSADDALPPSLDIAPLIRVPEGLQPSRTTRCSAHTTGLSDFPCPFIIGVRPWTSRCVPGQQQLWADLGSPGSHARCLRTSLTARDSGTPRDIGAPDGAFRFLLQRRRPGGRYLRG
jgi:hypothetical protein